MVFDLERPLLHPARHVDRHHLVAEMALELADDGGDGVGLEGGAAAGVEAVDRLDQAERGHLEEVVDGLGAAAVAEGERTGQRQEGLDQLLAHVWITRAVVLLQQPCLVPGHERNSSLLGASCRPAASAATP